MTCQSSRLFDIEEPMSVCTAAKMAELGRVAIDGRIELWIDGLTWIISRRPSVLFSAKTWLSLCTSTEQTGDRVEPLKGWPHAPHVRACGQVFGWSGPWPARSVDVHKLATSWCAKVTLLRLGPGQVEMAPPILS